MVRCGSHHTTVRSPSTGGHRRVDFYHKNNFMATNHKKPPNLHIYLENIKKILNVGNTGIEITETIGMLGTLVNSLTPDHTGCSRAHWGCAERSTDHCRTNATSGWLAWTGASRGPSCWSCPGGLKNNIGSEERVRTSRKRNFGTEKRKFRKNILWNIRYGSNMCQ